VAGTTASQLTFQDTIIGRWSPWAASPCWSWWWSALQRAVGDQGGVWTWSRSGPCPASWSPCSG